MKASYIKKVRRALVVPRRQKKDILRDLNEIFASAAEHGQTEDEVIARLGTPMEFARAMEEQLGVDRRARLRRRMLLCAIPTACLMLIFFFQYMVSRQPRQFSAGVIGGADGPTSIFITTAPTSPYAAPIFLALTLICLVFLTVLLVLWFYRRNK